MSNNRVKSGDVGRLVTSLRGLDGFYSTEGGTSVSFDRAVDAAVDIEKLFQLGLEATGEQ